MVLFFASFFSLLGGSGRGVLGKITQILILDSFSLLALGSQRPNSLFSQVLYKHLL